MDLYDPITTANPGFKLLFFKDGAHHQYTIHAWGIYDGSILALTAAGKFGLKRGFGVLSPDGVVESASGVFKSVNSWRRWAVKNPVAVLS